MSVSSLWWFFDWAWVGSEVVIAIATRTRNSSGNVRDRGTLYLLWIAILGSITLGSWFGETHGSNLPGGAPWLKLASLLVIIGGLALRWTAVITLGKSFSSNVAIHATQTVLKTGLYRWMRHPSYTGLLLCILAVGLHTRNWISVLIIFVPTSAVLLYRIHVEEIALREHFGQEYIDYSRATRRLIPGVY
ncbi:MAG TPA: isoprenylcysteine carboxylmethyltransferase family protein [Acidobacteriaceae bacterium]|jgi:protein-S-isoprenylcysteine O-methyltransferase Ste14|nr:isoprenylcysteine carboxylmethyltransferase family protein [Acidobacteriaceae bacterium]